MDSWDRVTEHDEGNNVDAVPFTLAPLEVVGFPNTWFVSTPGGESPADVAVPVRNSYAASLDVTVTVTGAPTWLAVTPATAALGIDEEMVITLSVERGALTPGSYEAEVVVTADGFEAFPVTIPVVFYVHGTNVPDMVVTPTTLDFETTIGVHPPLQTFELSNPGSGPLAWEAWPTADWISIAPPMGSGPAGYDEHVAVIVHPEGLAPGGPYIAQVQLYGSAPGGDRFVTARLVVGPCSEWSCNDGWTCDPVSLLCEPPTSCDDHDDCATGQHCPPQVGYCMTSGTCSTDLDCEFVWSDFGALDCDVTRGTCELATCAADADCPTASYCEETTGFCPRSGRCFSDAECFGAPFAFACDEARESCAPAVCDVDTDCPIASYCSTFWHQCVQTGGCTVDADCYPLGLLCDEPRTTCRP
jgi:hypothetical protein